MGTVRIGTSGWHYPSGPGSWNGVFYPGKSAGHGRRVDDLAFYAEHFDTVEVNSSFYRPPTPAMTGKWAKQTPAGFAFSLKLFQQFTHAAMYQKATSPDHPGDSDAGAIPTATRVEVDEFRRAIEPLADAGKLGALLAQFPPSFRDGEETREYLTWLLQSFKGFPMAVELRHRSWSDHEGAIVALLNEHAAAWTQIDEPKFRFSIRQHHVPNQRALHYIRLHGRNAEQWWTHDHPDQRYDYLYSPAELGGFADTVKTVRSLVQTIFLYLNNHFAGKAVANAAMLKHSLGQPVPGAYSPEMIRRYPLLASFVSTAADDSLFGGSRAEAEPGGEEAAEDAERQEG